MKNILTLGTVCLMMIGATGALAQDRAADHSAARAVVFNSLDGEALSFPSSAPPGRIVREFLRAEGVLPQTVDALFEVSSGFNPASGNTHLRLGQEFDGLDVYGAYVKAAIDSDGRLIHVIENLVSPPAGGLAPAAIDEAAALDAALSAVHPGIGFNLRPGGGSGDGVTFTGDSFFFQNPVVTRVAVAMQNGTMQEGFLVETWSDEDNLLHHTLIGGSGRVLNVELRTANDSYNIFPEEPISTPQTVVSGPGAGNAESPVGWLFAGDHSSIDIAGNNVNAYLDTDANNAADAGGSLISDGNFLAVADLTLEPEEPINQDVAVQNLFYFNNVIHDKLYAHGFVEGVGNFQEDNFGNGGSGGDSVLAEAQDGSGTNNANFATPSDGSNPRMQMYVWTQSSPKRDGDLDSDIIWHEYGHGLTWRMIGNMSGAMSGAIGEGMSDVLAILVNNDDVVAEYSFNNPIGIRSEPYTGYSRTYGDFTGNSVHFDGEIYAATIWKLWDIFQTEGIAQTTLFDYIVDGMNFTPAGPAFEDMRDGILQSVANAGSGHECLIWDAFAQFGIGVNAQANVKITGPPFAPRTQVSITEDFTEPSECTDGGTPSNDPPVADAGNDQTVTDSDGDGIEAVTLDGSGSSDPNGDDLSYSWSEGGSEIATGVSPTVNFAVGSHTVTLTVTETSTSDAFSDSDQVVITVNEDTGGFNLTATGDKVRGIHINELTWSGASSANVDVYRDGVVVATTANDGAYTDNTGNRGSATYVYQICEAGTSTCSNEDTVSF